MWLAALAAFRRRRAAIAVTALVIAALFGGSLAAFAGARRSATAMDRFLAYNRVEDADVVAPEGATDFDFAAVARLPQVRAAESASYVALAPTDNNGKPQLDRLGDINPYLRAPTVGDADAMHRPRVLHGRDLDLSEPLE